MSTPVKIALYASGIGALYWLITQAQSKLNEWSNKISFKIISFGVPELRMGTLSVPLLVRITNLTPVSIPITDFALTLSILKKGQYQAVGRTDNTGPFTINPGDQNITLYPRLDIAKLNPEGSNLLTAAVNILSNKNPLLDLKIDAEINVKGLIVTESQTQQIYLNKLLNAA